jgi:hypothetical protein
MCLISGCRHEAVENCAFLGYYAASSGNLLPTFRDNPSSPSSRVTETSVRNYHYSLSNSPEERRSKYKNGFLLLAVFSPWAGLAGTRAQSGDRYGSGTLHSGQVLRGSLPLLSPAFRRSHFRRQMPPCPQQRERS